MTKIPQKLHMIGRVHSCQGVKGAIFVLLNDQNPSWYDDWDTLLLSPIKADKSDDSTNVQSYSIARKAPHSKQGLKGYIVQLENIDDRNHAEELVKQTVWVPLEFVTSKDGETISLREILGFVVIDEQRGEVGPIVDFSSNSVQDLLVLEYKGGQFEVPFVDAFIQEIDVESKKIFMDIPLGLLGEE
jgi:16S rRNA processing protein RimM